MRVKIDNLNASSIERPMIERMLERIMSEIIKIIIVKKYL
tara:strand:- start:25 stop:144 length:120 start_codon:yes stop_codon:yes gene_type:complete